MRPGLILDHLGVVGMRSGLILDSLGKVDMRPVLKPTCTEGQYFKVMRNT